MVSEVTPTVSESNLGQTCTSSGSDKAAHSKAIAHNDMLVFRIARQVPRPLRLSLLTAQPRQR
jgi:hypothetical protein